ncbi:hypothetical protein K432DRAFT_313055, partial [Lepidopterella palustris CBS 459.81]
SSPPSIIQSCNQLTKGTEAMDHELVLMRDRVSRLEKVNEAGTRRKQRKRKQIQKRGTLTKADGEEIIA